MAVEKEGWVYIDGARKWQYVGLDGRSLCRRWMYLGRIEPEQGNDDSKDNCAACRKVLLAQRERAAT